MKRIKSQLFFTNFSWKSLFEAAFLSAYLYAFLEWLFIVTKPDFFSAVPLAQKIRIFLFTGSIIAVVVFTALAALFILSFAVRDQKAQDLMKNLGVLILAVILGSLSLLMIDNFTYTMFNFGIITTRSLARIIYLILYLGLIGYYFFDLKKFLPVLDRGPAQNETLRLRDGLMIIFILGSLVLNYDRPNSVDNASGTIARKQNGALPHIVLITADGLNARNTSAYGYTRETTPRVEELAQQSLVAENAFNNSGSTTGSVISIYTGKFPTETRTLYAPDILKGEDSYQHFPNILKRLGYYTIQYTEPRHTDAFARNILSGFDEANGKQAQQSIYQKTISRFLKTDYAYFLYELGNRIIDRLRHITYNKDMVTQEELTLGSTRAFKDQLKVDQVLQTIETSRQPVFAHIHWMGTHGATFHPQNRIFSKNKDAENQAMWDTDFYDDSIVDFDASVGMLIDHMNALGVYDETILIIGSDHSQNYFTNQKIPLIIHFPGGQHAGKILANVQNLDIAPTLLDYLQVDKPVWMEGTSLIDGEPGNRPIFGVATGHRVLNEKGVFEVETIEPPFYQFGYISVVYCGNWYRLDFSDYHWERGAVAGHTGSCAGETPVTDEDVFGWMRERLKQDGFDTSSLAQFSDIVKTIP